MKTVNHPPPGQARGQRLRGSQVPHQSKIFRMSPTSDEGHPYSFAFVSSTTVSSVMGSAGTTGSDF